MSSVKRPRGGRAAKPGRKPAPKRRNNKQADHQDDDPSGSDMDGGGPARPGLNLHPDPTVRAALTSAFRPPSKIHPSGGERAQPSALSLSSASPSSALPAAAAAAQRGTSKRVAMPDLTGEEDAAGNSDDRGHGDDDDDDNDSDHEERANRPAAIGADEPDDPDEPDEPASIPPQLLTRIMHGFFRRDGTRITRAANDAVARYADVFVREAIVRAAGAAGGPFLEVEDLEKVAPQLLLDL